MSKQNKPKQSVQKNTQLTDIFTYEPSRMIFSEAKELPIPDSIMTYKLITISTQNDDGSIGDLVVSTTPGKDPHPTHPEYDDETPHYIGGTFSFGVQENTSLETKKVTGYSMSLSLYNKAGATKEQKRWVEKFNTICDFTKEYLLDHKDDDSIGLYELERSGLSKLNPLYWKKEKGKIVEGTGPVLYPKLKTAGKKSGNKIISHFFSDLDVPLDPMELIGRLCHVDADIHIESIYIGGGKVSLQIKLYEACNILQIENNNGLRRLHNNRPKIEVIDTTKPEINDDDDDVKEQETKPEIKSDKVKKIIRVVKKVA